MAIVESGRPSPLETPFSRRMLLKGAVGAGTGVLLDQIPGQAQEPRFNKELMEPDFLTELKRKKDEIGDRKLTTREAMDLVPHISDMYAVRNKTEKSGKEFVRSTYVVPRLVESRHEDEVSGKPVTLKDKTVITSRTLNYLHETYPHISLHPFVADKIISHATNDEHVAGMTNPSGIFLFIDNINTPIPGDQLLEGTSRLAFGDIEHISPCETLTPFQNFLQTDLHEAGHFDIERMIVDDVYGFSFLADETTEAPYQFQPVEEFFADYIAVTTLNDYNLDFVTSYNLEPHDFKNFSDILTVSGLTDQDLALFHRNSALIDLFFALAYNTAKIPQSKEEHAFHAGKIMEAFYSDGRIAPDWNQLKEYYPNIDTNSYDYFDPQSKYIQWRPSTGCLPPQVS